jgi:hypothetical protein
MTDTGKQQPRAGAGGERSAAAGRGQRGPTPSSGQSGRNPSPGAPRPPQGQRKPGGASDEEERVQDIDDEEE